MKKNNSITFLLLSGVLILAVFTYVVTINIISDDIASKSYYANTNKNMIATIEDVSFVEGEIHLMVSDNTKEYCIKTTRTDPKDNSVCFKKVEANHIIVQVFSGKKYYVWIKDTNGLISSPRSINT